MPLLYFRLLDMHVRLYDLVELLLQFVFVLRKERRRLKQDLRVNLLLFGEAILTKLLSLLDELLALVEVCLERLRDHLSPLLGNLHLLL